MHPSPRVLHQKLNMQQPDVIIIGAGPSGLATAACLSRLSISYIILEREDCSASSWRKNCYDRLHLHLPKHICNLPHLPMPDSYTTYVSKDDFLRYLDNYTAHFNIRPLYCRCVDQARYDEVVEKWIVKVKNGAREEETYMARFLVVAIGENNDPFVPRIEGLSTFKGKVVHSTEYKSGKEFSDKNVLVVGAGNSGMEIALDLVNHRANTSIVVRSPVHILTRGILYLGLLLLKFSIPRGVVDSLLVMLSKAVYGDLTKYGIARAVEGPFFMIGKYRKYPVIDVGAVDKIKSRQIQVLPAITVVKGNNIWFENGHSHAFDAIVLATGFSSSSKLHRQGDDCLNGDELANPSLQNHWKGMNGLHRVGFARRGISGIATDAKMVAIDIKTFV
ncbi:hypothetical protein Dimus_032577 [Dionaea muscipula]